MKAKATVDKIRPSCSSHEQSELQQLRALFLKRNRPEGPIRNKNQWRLQVHVADQFSGLYPCLLFVTACLIATGVGCCSIDCSCYLLRIGPSGRFPFRNNARGCWRLGCSWLLQLGLFLSAVDLVSIARCCVDSFRCSLLRIAPLGWILFLNNARGLWSLGCSWLLQLWAQIYCFPMYTERNPSCWTNMPSCLRISLVLFSIKESKATSMPDRHMSGSKFIRCTRLPERNAILDHLNNLNHNLSHYEELSNSISKKISKQ